MGTHSLPVTVRCNFPGRDAPLGKPQAFSGARTDPSGTSAGWQRSPLERGSAAALVIALHAGAIAVVMLSHSPAPMSAKPGLVSFAVAADAGLAQRVAPRRDRRIVTPAKATPLPSAMDSGAAASTVPEVARVAEAPPPSVTTATGGDCDLTAPVQDALRQNDQVRRELATIPADSRSVANAVVVWNAGWSDAAAARALPAFVAIRQAITQSVGSSSASCRDQVQSGPRLLYLPDRAGKMMVLAVGSGQWTWQQLIDGARPAPAALQTGAAPPSAPFAQGPQATAPPGQTPGLNALLASLVRKRSPQDLPYYP